MTVRLLILFSVISDNKGQKLIRTFKKEKIKRGSEYIEMAMASDCQKEGVSP